LAIDVKGEHTGIRILGKVPNTSLVPTLTDIYSYMILSQALTSAGAPIHPPGVPLSPV
jgi:hypothetical protein